MELLDFYLSSKPRVDISLYWDLPDVKYITDKYAHGYISEFYDEKFSPKRNDVKNVLEVGIAGGGSILLWRDFFTNATIHGVDVGRCPYTENQERIVNHITNAYSTNFVNQFEKESFDIVIDDGPHTLDTWMFFIQYYLPLVKPGGIFVIEDISEVHCTPMLVNMINRIDPSYKTTVFDMRGKQKDSFLLNKWKTGNDVIVVEK